MSREPAAAADRPRTIVNQIRRAPHDRPHIVIRAWPASSLRTRVTIESRLRTTLRRSLTERPPSRQQVDRDWTMRCDATVRHLQGAVEPLRRLR
jgi:hypothetical protein